MEIYILDSLYRRVDVLDTFNSLVWAERFSSWGDFVLTINADSDSRKRLPVGTRFGLKDSYRVMTVETIEDTTDDEGLAILNVRGRTLEMILENRLAIDSDETDWFKWIRIGTPKGLAEEIFFEICQNGLLDPGDIIAGVVMDNIFPVDTIPEPDDEIDYEIDPQSVYQAIKDLCDAYQMGFRLVKDLDTSILYFDVYMGSDRTTQQSILPVVIFSPDLENLRNTNHLTSTALYKNVAYVVSPVGHEIVYPLDVDPETDGFERHVLYVNASDIDDVDPGIASARMIQRGKDELAKNRRVSAFDGELNQNSQYRYGVDYNLGDLVELRNSDGTTSIMRVTEQIFASDEQGDRSYPTLSIDQFVTPGSWLSMGPTVVWEDMGETEYWEDQP